MQKLNCKTNAAGWVPSSGNRTAQAFSQPGKGAVAHVVGGTVRLGGGVGIASGLSGGMTGNNSASGNKNNTKQL